MNRWNPPYHLSNYDGLLIAGGPSKFTQCEGREPKNTVVVNMSVKGLEIARRYEVIMLDAAQHMMDYYWNRRDILAKFIIPEEVDKDDRFNGFTRETFKTDKKLNKLRRLDPGPDSHIINFGITVWSALHRLTKKGSRRILGLGVDLEEYPNGSYNGFGGPCPAASANWPTIRKQWNAFILPELKRLGITFHSKAFYYEDQN